MVPYYHGALGVPCNNVVDNKFMVTHYALLWDIIFMAPYYHGALGVCAIFMVGYYHGAPGVPCNNEMLILPWRSGSAVQ